MPDTLSQCIEREREATVKLRNALQILDVALPEEAHQLELAYAASDAARAATDDAVRDLTRWAHELIATADAMADRLALPQAVQDELDSIALAIARALPAPTAQGESTGGEGDE